MTPSTLLVGQSGGPTPVINASLAGLLEEGRRLGCFPRIAGLRHGIEGALHDDVVSLDQLTAADWDALAQTPAAALGSCRHPLAPEDEARVLDTFARHGVRWFCYIGGNDSMDTGDRLRRAAADAGMELAVCGVPKTIDNDLVETDHSPGYGSAARYWATVTQEATLDLAAMRTYDRVLVLETMGRNSGWLTAACALFKQDNRDGPHILLTPERAFHEAPFLGQVEHALARVGYCVVATAETIRDDAGAYVARARGGSDRFGHPIVSAVGETLADLITARLGVKTRINKPGTFQRTSAALVSPVDVAEARQAGREAARRLAAGEGGGMITLSRPDMGPYRCEYGVVALERVAHRERRLPDSYLDGASSGVTSAFLAYAAPLLGAAPARAFRIA